MFISRSVIVSPLTVSLTGILVLALQVSHLNLYYFMFITLPTYLADANVWSPIKNNWRASKVSETLTGVQIQAGAVYDICMEVRVA